MNINANYKAIPLVGTMNKGELGDGISGASVHQIYCLASGSIDITPIGGGTFTWSATTNEFINVVVGAITVNSGTFIGFKARTDSYQFFSNNI